MSRDEMYTCSIICPCKNGKITQKNYIDDWNKHQEGPIVIECKDCSKKYKIEDVHKHKYDGSSITYHYLIPKNYPDYKSIYPKAVSLYKDFISWLIETYTEEDLKKGLSLFENTTSSTKLTGIAKEICKSYKKAKNTTRISEIIKTVKSALEKYSNYNGNKKQRDDEKSAYDKEKNKHKILINLKMDR